MTTNAGILGIGMYLPPEVRRNDWWPESVVASWMAQRKAARSGPPRPPRNEGEALVMKAMSEQAIDPFQGAVERHVKPTDMSIVDMQEQAARMAIERAGIAPASIDLLLTHTVLPEYLLSNPACRLHERLGLSNACFCMETDAAAFAFMMQLSIAQGMIASGQAKIALLVQSCDATGHVDPSDPIAPLFGDGATAVVIGGVREEYGLKGAAYFCDGRFPNTLVAGVRGGRWYDDGPARIHVADGAQMQEVFLLTASACKESISKVLETAGIDASAIDFFAMYQGTPWLRRVVQDHAGLGRAKSIDTFAETGYLFGAIIPASLHFASARGLLASGDLLLLTGGGTGMTYGSIVLRWGV